MADLEEFGEMICRAHETTEKYKPSPTLTFKATWKNPQILRTTTW